MRILLFLVLLLGCCECNAGACASTASRATWSQSRFIRTPNSTDKSSLVPTGMISFPLAGQIRASGLTPDALANVIKSRLRGKFTEEPDVTVSLVANKIIEEDLKPKVFITGEVLRPGPFVMRTKLDLMQAIAVAGGFSPFAAKKRIQVRRKINGVESLFVFNYDDFFSGRNFDDNLVLHAGDVIIVPERGLFE